MLHRVAALLLLLLLACDAIGGDAGGGGKWDTYADADSHPDTPLSDIARAVKDRPIAGGWTWSLGGAAQERFQAQDNRRDFSFEKNDEDASLLSRTRLNTTFNYGHLFKAFVEVQDSHEFWRDRLPGTNPNENSLDFYQAYAEFGLLDDIADKPMLSIKAGRQEFVLGNGRLFSNNDWLNNGTNWDMVRVTGRPDGFEFDAFAGWPVTADTNNPDSPASHRNIAGLNVKAVGIPLGHIVEGFLVYKWDEKTDYTGEGRGDRGPEREWVLNGSAHGKFFTNFDYNLDLTGELGQRGSNQIRAWRGGGQVGYTLPMLWRWVRFAFDYSLASGDKDPTDRRQETFDTLFGDQFGFRSKFLLAAEKNLEDLNPKFAARAWRGGMIELDYHHFELMQARDGFYASNGTVLRRDKSGNAGRYAGQEIDLQITHAFNDNLSLSGGAFMFMPARLFSQSGNHGDSFARNYFLMLRIGF